MLARLTQLWTTQDTVGGTTDNVHAGPVQRNRDPVARFSRPCIFEARNDFVVQIVDKEVELFIDVILDNLRVDGLLKEVDVVVVGGTGHDLPDQIKAEVCLGLAGVLINGGGGDDEDGVRIELGDGKREAAARELWKDEIGTGECDEARYLFVTIANDELCL